MSRWCSRIGISGDGWVEEEDSCIVLFGAVRFKLDYGMGWVLATGRGTRNFMNNGAHRVRRARQNEVI